MRGRGLRRLLILVVVLGGLFTAADRLAVAYAESQAADRLQNSQGLIAKPSVSIKGFPFLTQVAHRQLTEVTVTASDVQSSNGTDRLRISQFTADLRDVRINGGFFGGNGGLSSVVANSATGTALVAYTELARQAPSGVSIEYGGKDAQGNGLVKLTGSYSLPWAGTQKISVTGHVVVQGGNAIRLKADGKPVILGVRLPVDVERLIKRQADFGGVLSGLPSGITLGSVAATPAGLQVSLAGTDVRVAGH